MGKTSSVVKNRWNEKNYDNFRVFIRKGTKVQLQAWCEAHEKSVGGLVKELLEKETGLDLS